MKPKQKSFDSNIQGLFKRRCTVAIFKKIPNENKRTVCMNRMNEILRKKLKTSKIV